jgi:hypothetical protein
VTDALDDRSRWVNEEQYNDELQCFRAKHNQHGAGCNLFSPQAVVKIRPSNPFVYIDVNVGAVGNMPFIKKLNADGLELYGVQYKLLCVVYRCVRNGAPHFVAEARWSGGYLIRFDSLKGRGKEVSFRVRRWKWIFSEGRRASENYNVVGLIYQREV